MKWIQLRGVRTHNLQNIDLDLPRDCFIVITGLSGSGKSSLAFDTLYAEGQRRYVESLSSYARQFLSIMEKPEVEYIEGLSPAISIEQKSTSHNPRSTVGTVTEVYDYLRLLFARVGIPHCPTHGHSLSAQTISQMVDQIFTLPANLQLMLLSPVVRERKGEYAQLFQELEKQGFLRVRLNGQVILTEDVPNLDSRKKHTIEVVVDRFRARKEVQQRVADSLATALKLSGGLAKIVFTKEERQEEWLFSANFACPECGYSVGELSPRLFSFNSPVGACPACNGLGHQPFFDSKKLIMDTDLSLSEGAISGWDQIGTSYIQQYQALGQKYHFRLSTPFRKLSEKVQHLLLYGEPVSGNSLSAAEKKQALPPQTLFKGIIPILEKQYETADVSLKEELENYLSLQPCRDCQGSRLNQVARQVMINGYTLSQLVELPINQSLNFFNQLELTGQRGEIASKILKEVRERLQFLINVGLDYLTLARSAETLSGGEAQRIRLASQIGAGLMGVMYVLDEPSIGLHQRDNQRLLNSLLRLRNLGNTVIVVEHDEEAIRAADHIVDIGPGAGVHGGRVVAQGTVADIIQSAESITGQFLSKKRKILVPKLRKSRNLQQLIVLKGASGNNLQSINLELPVGLITCITGVSGSGKSTLINDTLYPAVANHLHKSHLKIAPYTEISGLESVDKVVNIDQSPIGRTPRSNPATYSGVLTPIRELFAATPESRIRGYAAGRFSFNVKGGRCEACQGDGLIKVEMHFLPDVYVVCDVCRGQRYNRETLEVKYKNKNIFEVLSMTVEEALVFFRTIPGLLQKLQTLVDVGLAYLTLGQNSVTLSGGEAQRVKLARELSKRDTGKTLYILDEPTTGLHFHDIEQLLGILQRLRDHGNTVVVIEHNLEVIKTADWIVDLGPEGGSGGGQVIAVGTPEQIAKQSHSYTGQFLREWLGTRAK